MNGRRNAWASAAITCLLLTGCGEDDDTKRPDAALDRPLQPRCATEDFAKPRITDLSEGAKPKDRTWSLQYTRIQNPSKPAPGQPTTTILLVEYPPTTPNPKKNPRVKNLTIAGRQVALNTPTKTAEKQGTAAVTAQWRTKRAFYTIIANGSDSTTVKRFITCLP